MLSRTAFLCLLALSLPPALRAHAPSIGLSGTYLNFVASPCGPNAAPRVVVLSNTTHGRMAWSTTVATDKGGNWLSVSPSSGTLPGLVDGEFANLTVSAVSAPLPAGVYYGTITIVAPGDSPPCDPCQPPADNTPQIIEVGGARRPQQP